MSFIDVYDDEYVCSLNEKSIEKAKKELHEDPKDRLDAVKALRKWIEEQPHLRAKTDTIFLLSVLRTKKFSQLESRNMVENMYKMRESIPEWFTNIDPRKESIQAVIGTGFFLPLPGTDDEGRKVILSVRGNIDPGSKVYDPIVDVIKASAVASMIINADENNQVNGYVYLMDFSRFTMRHQNMMPFDKMRKLMKSWLGNFPGRFKAFHIYNAGSFLEFMMTIFKQLMPAKYTKRMYVHSNLESVYKHIPKHLLPEEYLPDDYTGPSAGTFAHLIENLKNDTLEKSFVQHAITGSSDKYGIDEDKRPVDVVQSSFRKLNVD